MLAWIRDHFNSRVCLGCLALDRLLKEKDEARDRAEDHWQAREEFLCEEIQYLKDELKEAHRKLYQAVRLTDHAAAPPAEQTPSGESKRTVNTRSWPRLQQELERAALKKKPDDDKEAYWREQNSKKEKEIPELAAKLAEREQTSQDEIQQDVDFLSN